MKVWIEKNINKYENGEEYFWAYPYATWSKAVRAMRKEAEETLQQERDENEDQTLQFGECASNYIYLEVGEHRYEWALEEFDLIEE